MASRRKLIVVGTVVGGTALLAALAWWWWLPELVRERARVAAETRLGMQVEIGSASMRLGGAVLSDVVLLGRHGGVRVTVDEVGVAGALPSLALSGAEAIEEVQARGLRVEVDFAEPGASDSISGIRESLRGPDADVGSGAVGGRTLSALDVTVEVDDGEGSLIRVEGGEVRREEGSWTLVAGVVTVGGEPGDLLRVEAATLRLRRGEAGWALLGAEVGGGELVWARRGGDPTDEGAASEDQDEAQPTVITRLSSALEGLRGDRGEEVGAAAAEGAAVPPWLSALGEDEGVQVSGFTIHTRTEAGRETLLSELELSLSQGDGQRLHAEGSGVAAQGGALRWDLLLSPAELGGEGSVSFEDVPLAFVAPLLPEIPWHAPEHARLDGDVVLRGEGPDRIAVRGHAALRDAALYSARIGPEPISGIAFEAAGEAVWSPPRRRLELTSAQLTMGEATAELRGAIEWRPERYAIDLVATLPPTPCGTALGAIPRDLLAELGGFSWNGTLGARARLRLDSDALDDTELDIDVSESCEFETVPAMADLRRIEAPFMHRVREPDGTWFEMTAGPGSGNWSSIYAMSPFFVHAVLAHEDASFFRHGGFAPWAIRDALVRNLREHRFVYGASTITMQLAKNLFLHREKTLARKVQEVLLTWWLEKALEKVDILELYLNVIEYGPSIYGIREAARHYFGRDPSEVSPAEAAFLASILPAPKLYHGQYERGELSPSLANRMRRLLRHMAARGRIDEAARDHGLAEIDTFHFFRDGGAPPGPRIIAGTATPLPFQAVGPWEDWDTWEVEEGFEDAPEVMQPDG